MSDDFNRRRLAAMDSLRQDSRLTPAARLVGLEIFARVNRTSLDAWPAESTIAAALGIEIKTVKRAIAALEKSRYFEIARRRGESNRYRPNFVVRTTGAENVPSPQSEPEDKIPTGGGKNGPPDRDKNGLQSPLRNPLRTPSTALAQQQATFHGSRQQTAFEHNEDLRERRGDELVEAELIRQLGADGLDVLGRLLEIDGGRPRLRLIKAARAGQLREDDLAAARLVAMRGGSSDRQPSQRQMLHTTSTSATDDHGKG
jgi:DNA-binding MarR family transcriptional regulator